MYIYKIQLRNGSENYVLRILFLRVKNINLILNYFLNITILLEKQDRSFLKVSYPSLNYFIAQDSALISEDDFTLPALLFAVARNM